MPSVHRRTRSTTSDDETGNGANYCFTSPLIVTSINDPDIYDSDHGLIPAPSQQITHIMMSHFTTIGENFNQQLSARYSVIQSLLETIKANRSQLTTTQTKVTTASQSITNIENQPTSFQHQTSNFVANSKIQDIEKEVQTLHAANTPDPKIASLEQEVKDL